MSFIRAFTVHPPHFGQTDFTDSLSTFELCAGIIIFVTHTHEPVDNEVLQLYSPSSTTDERILSAVKHGKAVTRAELARTLRLAPSTISAAVSSLIQRGFLRESHSQNITGGRPAKILVMTNARPCYIAVDFCSLATHIACADLDGEIFSVTELHLKLEKGPDAALREVVEHLHAIIRTSPSTISIMGIVVSLQGHVDKQYGTLGQVYVLPAWSGFPMRERLSQYFDVPILVVNSARAEALAEHMQHPGFRHSVTVRVSTCIGTGVIIDSQVYEGSAGLAGDLVHTPVVFDDTANLCACGNRGCLLTVASAKALAEQYSLQMGKKMTVNDYLEAAHAGEPIATNLARTAGRALGRVLSLIVNFLNPDGVYIGGVLSEVEPYLAAVRCSLYDVCLPTATHGIEISRTTLGDRGAMVGSLFFLREQLGSW